MRKTKQKKPETAYSIKQLKRTDEFASYADLISVLFSSQETATKSEVRNALKAHLEREV